MSSYTYNSDFVHRLASTPDGRSNRPTTSRRTRMRGASQWKNEYHQSLSFVRSYWKTFRVASYQEGVSDLCLVWNDTTRGFIHQIEEKIMLHFCKVLEPTEIGLLNVHYGIAQPHKTSLFENRICRGKCKNAASQAWVRFSIPGLVAFLAFFFYIF